MSQNVKSMTLMRREREGERGILRNAKGKKGKNWPNRVKGILHFLLACLVVRMKQWHLWQGFRRSNFVTSTIVNNAWQCNIMFQWCKSPFCFILYLHGACLRCRCRCCCYCCNQKYISSSLAHRFETGDANDVVSYLNIHFYVRK